MCDTLYDALGPGEKSLRLSHYRELGQARQILEGTIWTASWRPYPTRDRKLTKDVLKALVTVEETPKAARVEDIARSVGEPAQPVERILRDSPIAAWYGRPHGTRGSGTSSPTNYLVEEDPELAE